MTDKGQIDGRLDPLGMDLVLTDGPLGCVSRSLEPCDPREQADDQSDHGARDGVTQRKQPHRTVPDASGQQSKTHCDSSDSPGHKVP